MKTADGVEITVGMTVWVLNSVIGDYIKYPPTEHVVGGIVNQHKLLYDKPSEGYIGARIASCYARYHEARTATMLRAGGIDNEMIGDSEARCPKCKCTSGSFIFPRSLKCSWCNYTADVKEFVTPEKLAKLEVGNPG